MVGGTSGTGQCIVYQNSRLGGEAGTGGSCTLV